MSEPFDPYYVWLGIPPEEQPPHHYRLLGLRPLESNPDVISNAVDQRRTHLRTFQAGKRGVLSQKLLNEVSAAGVCLLDVVKKQQYDVELRARIGPASASGIGLAGPPLKVARALTDQETAAVVPLTRTAPLGQPVPLQPVPAQVVADPAWPTTGVAVSPVLTKPDRAASNSTSAVLLLGGGLAALVMLAAVVGLAWWQFGDSDDVAVGPKPPRPGPKPPVRTVPTPANPLTPNPGPKPSPSPSPGPTPNSPVDPSPGFHSSRPSSSSPRPNPSGHPSVQKEIWMADVPDSRVLRQFGSTWVEYQGNSQLWLDRMGGPPNATGLIDPVTRRSLMVFDDRLEMAHPLQAPAVITTGRWITEGELPPFARRPKAPSRPDALAYRDANWDALVFDGESAVEIPVPAELTQAGTEFTLEMWIRLEPDRPLIQILHSPALEIASEPARRQPGRPGLPIQVRAGATAITFYPPIEGRKWHHFAIVRDKTMLRFLCDGRISMGIPVDSSFALAGPSLALGRGRQPGMCGLVRDLRISSVARYQKSQPPPFRFVNDDQTLVLPKFEGSKLPAIEDLSGHGHAVQRGTAQWLPLAADGLVMAELPGTHVDLRRAYAASRNTLRGDTWRTSDTAETRNAEGTGQMLVPYDPPAEYDVEFSVTRSGGGGGALWGLVVGSEEEPKQIAVAIAAYPKDGQPRIGVLPTDMSQLDAALTRCNFQVSAGPEQRFKLEVRQPTPDAYLLRIFADGREVYQTQQPLASAGLPSQLDMPHRTSLFWGSQDAALRYTEMKLVPVVGGQPAPQYLTQAARFEGSSRPGGTRPSPGIGPVVTNPPAVPTTPINNPQPPTATRKPVPSADELAEKVTEARTLYQDEFKKATKAEQKSALARSIERAGEGTTSDQTARYVLLDLARKVYVQAGDVSSALAAARNLEMEYDVQPSSVICSTVEGLNDVQLEPVRRAELANISADLAEELLGIGDYDRADQLSAIAVQSANKQKEAELKKQMVQRRAEVTRIVKEHASIKPHLETLGTTADDPAANLAVGKFYALTLEEWPRALPHLAKAGDGSYSAAAELDKKAAAGGAAEQLAAAEAWLALADTTKPADDKAALQRRGKDLIHSAVGSLTGLDKLKAEKRLEKLVDLGPARQIRPPSFLPGSPAGSSPGVSSSSSPSPGPTGRPPAMPGGLTAGFIGRVFRDDADAGIVVKCEHGYLVAADDIDRLTAAVGAGGRIRVEFAAMLMLPADTEVTVRHAGGSASGGVHTLFVDNREVNKVGDDLSKDRTDTLMLRRGVHMIRWQWTGGDLGSALLQFSTADDRQVVGFTPGMEASAQRGSRSTITMGDVR